MSNTSTTSKQYKPPFTIAPGKDGAFVMDSNGFVLPNAVIETMLNEAAKVKEALADVADRATYYGDEDDCGSHACCGAVSYGPHFSHCKAAIALGLPTKR